MADFLPHQTRIQHVRLRVKDLSSARTFYEQLLGFRVVKDDGQAVALSATGQPPAHVFLTEDRGAAHRPPRSPGLFHVAFRYPHRAALAAALQRLLHHGYPIHGASDHAVSEAVYLADPEGNGIELYCDRPRESWHHQDGEVYMVTEPLDVDGLLAESSSPALTIDPQTDVGHIHLSVSNLSKAEAFYADVLGFEITTRSYPGALFLAAGGYHHHIGANVWYTRNGSPAPAHALGLIEFGIAVPAAGWDELIQRLTKAGTPIEQKQAERIYLRDLDGIGVELMINDEEVKG